MNADVASVNAPADAAAMPVIRHPRRTRPARRERNESCRCVKAAGANAAQLPMRIPCADWIPSRLRGPSVAGMPGKSAKGEKILTASSEPRERLLVLMRRRFQLPRRAERRIYRLMRTRRRAAVSKTAGRWFEANRVCQSLVFFRGLPPPTPRPGRFAFHPSIVSGSQPRVRPIMASGSGSLRLSRPPLVMPRRSATCLTPRDMQPENTRHAANLNDRRTRQTINGTTWMLIHPLPPARHPRPSTGPRT